MDNHKLSVPEKVVSPSEVIPRTSAAFNEPFETQSNSGLVEYWRIVLRHKGTVLLLFILGGMAGFLYTLPQTPIYRAHATMEVQGINQDFLNLKDVSPTATAISLDPTADILTQVKLLESPSLRERALAKMKATPVPLERPSFVSERVATWK